VERSVRFTTTPRGVQVAWAQVGSGPVILAPPGWVSHLGHLWDEPASRAFQEALAEGHTFVTLDRPGTGLSDRHRSDFSMDADLDALEAVIAAQGAARMSLLGISQGGALACVLAARRPELVDRLVLYGSFARGRLVGSPQIRSAVVALVRRHWGLGSRTLAQLFVGEGADDPAEAEAFATFQRESASGEMAASLLEGLYEMDVRDALPRIRAPTLVIHRERDQAISIRCGRELAASIAGARFVSLPGAAHLAWVGDWGALVDTIREFLGDPPRARPRGPAGRGAEAARGAPPRPPGYELEHRELDDPRAVPGARVRVAVAQTDVRLEDHEPRGSGLLGLRRSAVAPTLERLARLVESAARSHADLVLFPELAADLAHPEIAETIAALARAHRLLIVPGSFHDPAREANVARAFGPEGPLWEQEKHIPATLTLGGRRFTEGIRPSPSRKVVVAGTRWGRIAIVICRDYLDLDLRAALRHAEPPVDLVLNPAFTPVTADFEAVHLEARRAIYACSLFANAAAFGRSLAHAPERGRRRRPLAPGVETVLFKDLDLGALRAARLEWDRRHGVDARFIQSTR
jgi:pimeloyl-ACP methyl ester carboxylesterase/predicted amidohydrolase